VRKPVTKIVRESELRRRRSRVPWIYLVYHVRERQPQTPHRRSGEREISGVFEQEKGDKETLFRTPLVAADGLEL
jgi:hypothetical protein